MSAFLSRDFEGKKKENVGRVGLRAMHRVHIIIGDEGRGTLRVAVISGGFQIPLMHMTEARNIE